MPQPNCVGLLLLGACHCSKKLAKLRNKPEDSQASTMHYKHDTWNAVLLMSTACKSPSHLDPTQTALPQTDIALSTQSFAKITAQAEFGADF